MHGWRVLAQQNGGQHSSINNTAGDADIQYQILSVTWRVYQYNTVQRAGQYARSPNITVLCFNTHCVGSGFDSTVGDQRF
jgi:hypothetical protein